MRHRTVLIPALAAFALVAGACGGDDPTVDGGTGGGTIEIGGEKANDHGSADASGETALALELDDNYFEPTVIEGEAGQTLTLEAFNEGDAPHTVTIAGTDIDEVLQPGDTADIEVTFPDSGALVFHCHFHDSQGMRGALSVGGSLEVTNADDSGEHEDTEGGAEEEDDEGKY